MKNDHGKSDCVTLELPGETGFNDHWITGSRIKDHQTKDPGSVKNELIDKLSKLIGMSDGSSTLLSQNLFLAKGAVFLALPQSADFHATLKNAWSQFR